MSCVKIIIFLIIELFNHFECVKEPFILGGDYTNIKKFPHSVFLVIDCGDGEIICGSSILNHRVLLTAAHCLINCKGREDPLIKAYAGHEDSAKSTVVIDADDFSINKKYDDITIQHDIALVRLSKSLPLGKKIKRVMITEQFIPHERAFVAGWGVIDAAGEVHTETLKYVEQKMTSLELCRQYGPVPEILCTESVDDNVIERPAEGDSGSALCTDEGEQLGIVSYRDPRNERAVIHTNVTFYYKWIKEETKKIYCKG